MTNQTSITRYHLESLYRVMLKRLAKGYSSSELSFLIGRETNYINKVETLQAPFYSELELKQIGAALEEDNAADMMAEADKKELLNIAVVNEQEGLSLTRAYYTINGINERKLLFMFTEQTLGEYEEDPAEEACLQSVRTLIGALCNSGYFHENRNALEIFEVLRPLTAFKLTPFFVKWALEWMWEPDNPDRLLIKRVQDGLCYGFDAY